MSFDPAASAFDHERLGSGREQRKEGCGAFGHAVARVDRVRGRLLYVAVDLLRSGRATYAFESA